MTIVDTALTLIETPDDVADYQRWLGGRRPVLGLDTETTGLHPVRDTVRLIQFGDASSGWAMDAVKWGGLAQWTLETYDAKITLHNASFDVPRLERLGWLVPRPQIDDTLLMSRVLHSSKLVHGLKPLTMELLGPVADVGATALSAAMETNGWDWGTVPPDLPAYWQYSALDPVLSCRLWEHLTPLLAARDLQQIYSLDLGAMWACVDAERRGMSVDIAYGEQMRDKLTVRSDSLHADALDKFGVSIGSNKQLVAALRRDGVPLTKLTSTAEKRIKKGATTLAGEEADNNFALDKEVISGLQGKHPLCDHLIEFRQGVKFKASYFDAVLNRHVDGIIHPSINVTGARTGRMSVSGPPLQQLPSSDTMVRRLFVPRPGRALLSVDLSNIEVRVVAHFSGDPTMIAAFERGEDVHMAMARKMYGEGAGGKERKASKSGSLGKQYGIGVDTFAVQQGVTVAEAKKFLEFYAATFPRVAGLASVLQEMASERLLAEGLAYVRTPAGRVIELTAAEVRANSWYKLVAFGCQGYSADVLKLAIVALDAAGLLEEGGFVLPVHDELLFDCPSDRVTEVGEAVRDVMVGVVSLAVPLSADIETYAESWAESVV